MRKVIFLDRDGVLNLDLGYTYKAKDLKIIEGVPKALEVLAQMGFDFVIVTNQSGVARGLYSLADVDAFNEALLSEIQKSFSKFQVLEIAVCPHMPDGKIAEYSIDCECRKPGTKMVLDAIKKYEINPNESWMIGDKSSDIDCGKSAGLKSIQLTQGGKQYPHHSSPFAKCNRLIDAVKVIQAI
ncbi:MAG: HAD family hydrolase [Proteobacteria bacterium]|nr:HAD family hydrolase [Pseudomonadota bacterium]